LTVAVGLLLRILYWTLTDMRVGLACWSVLRSRFSSRLHDSDVRDGFVLATPPVEDDVRDLHVSALDRELRPLDVLLERLPLFALISALGSVDLITFSPSKIHLSAALAAAEGEQQDDGRDGETSP
jgi:hypothetical protein